MHRRLIVQFSIFSCATALTAPFIPKRAPLAIFFHHLCTLFILLPRLVILLRRAFVHESTGGCECTHGLRTIRNLWPVDPRCVWKPIAIYARSAFSYPADWRYVVCVSYTRTPIGAVIILSTGDFMPQSILSVFACCMQSIWKSHFSSRFWFFTLFCIPLLGISTLSAPICTVIDQRLLD
jgi:hypothetical protein